ncbi:branched-chain amino acid transport system II carrier protein [Candidatus Paracaedibacter symbiosus]|uniref:branched-chain amino acid transport system II carrier protein n=1 Tax=Candidatus Paracaedibacter symbiosus TaxID=244582 RepID=UPI00068B8C69|nr:branched-chain amino acid transport system II carrier protein [Candidatus Paracaedibacter symbiosus]
MSHKKMVLTAGFAMFSMFFGSGNLVFPLLLGQQTISAYPFSIVGLIVTAVIVPFLGLLGMILYDGSTKKYFEKLGKVPSFLLIAMMLSLMGPFGVVPRCITVAYGSVSVLFPWLPYYVFSFFFCVSIAALIWQANKVIDLIGLLLTPFKLGGLMLLLLVGLWFGEPTAATDLSAKAAFTSGLTLGYQTMDLMAAFFFSSTTVIYLRNNLGPDVGRMTLLKLSIAASLIGASILSFAYIGFVTLGAKYSAFLTTAQPEAMLAVVAQHTLGDYALPIISLTMAVACLATAVILSTLFVDFLRDDVLRQKITRPQSIFVSLGTTFGVSLLGFAKICELLGTVLEVAYPALIALAITNICNKLFDMRQGKFPFWITLGISGLMKVCRVFVL